MIQRKETIWPVQDETAVVVLNLSTLTQLYIYEMRAYKVNKRNFETDLINKQTNVERQQNRYYYVKLTFMLNYCDIELAI